jgi:hypothetical protein
MTEQQGNEPIFPPQAMILSVAERRLIVNVFLVFLDTPHA